MKILQRCAAFPLLIACTIFWALVVHAAQPAQTGDPDWITIVFGGDVMLGRNVASDVQASGRGDYAFPWLNIADFFSEADIAFVNLECPITDRGYLNWLKPAPWLRADPEAVTGLEFAGIDIVSVANNHAFDYGRSGFEDSLGILDAAGIRCTGGGLTYDEAYDPVYLTVKGKKIAFLAYTKILYYPCYFWRALKPSFWSSGSSGIAWLTQDSLASGISRARENSADLIVVSMHLGQEYETDPSSTQEEYMTLAIDLGADIVVGHHPHVAQPTVAYGDGYICYSLGNLIFDQKASTHAGVTRGIVLEVVLYKGEIVELSELGIRIDEATSQPAFE